MQAALFITTLQTYLANLQFAEAQQVISKAYPYGVRITTVSLNMRLFCLHSPMSPKWG